MAEHDVQQVPGLVAPNLGNPGEGMLTVESARAVQEVYMMMLAARNFPRDRVRAIDAMLVECMEVDLAKDATYLYKRGGQDITGPSIRLAEVLAQKWGNIEFGFREVSRTQGSSSMMSFALDLETNSRVTRTIEVPHIRISHDKQGNMVRTDLDNPRDIKEATANQAQRGVRECILGLIPRYIVDKALAQCRKTLHDNVEVTTETIQKIIEEYAKIGVTAQQLEGFIGRHMDAITPSQYLKLRDIYRSIMEGVAEVEQWFAPAPEQETNGAEQEGGVAGLKSTLKGAEQQQAPPQAQPAEPPASAPPATESKADAKTAPQTAPESTQPPAATDEGGPFEIPVPEKDTARGTTHDWQAWCRNLLEFIEAAATTGEVEQWVLLNEGVLNTAPQRVKKQIEAAATKQHQAIVDGGGMFN